MNEFACPAYRHALISPWLKGRLRRHKKRATNPFKFAEGGSELGVFKVRGKAARYVTERKFFPAGRWDEWSGEEEEAGLTV